MSYGFGRGKTGSFYCFNCIFSFAELTSFGSFAPALKGGKGRKGV